MADKFKKVKNQIDFIELEHDILKFWEENQIFNKLVSKNEGNEPWSFMDGPITANNPMGVHHAWGRSLKDIFQRFHAMKGHDLRYQNGFDCQGLWVEVEVEKELGFKSKKDIEDFGIEKFVNMCKDRVTKFSKIQTEQSKRLGYWMDWDNSYYTMSDENNYTIWGFLKKLFDEGKIYRGTDVVPWSGRSGTSYSQMEIIEGRKLVAHRSVFVKFPLVDKENEYLLVWTTTPWTLTSNIAAAVNVNLNYIKLQASDGSIYYFAEENLKFARLDKQFKDKKQWIKGVPKLKTIEQIFNERGGYKVLEKIKGSELVGLKYQGPFDQLEVQNIPGGYPFTNEKLEKEGITAIDCHKVIDGGKDNVGNDIVVAGEGTGIVHMATGCGAIDNKIGKKNNLVEIAPLNDEAKYLEGFGFLTGKTATSESTRDEIIQYLKENNFLLYQEDYPHVYPHCWRSGDELVYRSVDEWYINMDWRDNIKKVVGDINWIPEWGHDREMEWLENMGDWMISKKRFWGLALPIWVFEDKSFYVIGSKEELEELAVEGFEEFKNHSPHRPWIDRVKIRHPETGLIGTRIPDVGNPWLDAGIVPYSTLKYNSDKEYWKKWFPPDFVVECFPGQFRNWFYSLLAMSTMLEQKAPFKTLLGHALVKDETGRDMHKSWGNAIWFEDAAEKMGVDVMRWLYASQNPEHNLLFGYGIADEVRKKIITLWNTYYFFVTYANLDDFDPNKVNVDESDYTILDKWISSKMNEFINDSKNYYEKFEVYKLMQESSIVLDHLSNWYIRRNRRRFWKSENDNDKNAAYLTLYNALITYTKIMAPIIPFITEEIYGNLSKESESIHLTSFPEYDKSNTNESIIKEIDDIINIVNLSRSARNKANIKVRQPLSTLNIYAKDDISKTINRNQKQIKEELNIKEINIVDNVSSILSYKIKPNFALLSQKYSSDMKLIINSLNQSNQSDLIKQIESDKKIEISINSENIEINEEELIIEEIPNNGLCVNGNRDFKIGLDVEITEDLKMEGIIRDLIRQIQNLRKKSNLNVSDRIEFAFLGNQKIHDSIEKFKDYLMNETLIELISEDVEKLDFKEDFTIDNIKVSISISKIK
tara:strand:- start:13235 stop:16528 length:3294 start_codon:yes stop_codon:yes gene_type:complete